MPRFRSSQYTRRRLVWPLEVTNTLAGIVTVEVAFNVAQHVVRAVLAGDLQVIARILAGGAKFSQVALDRIAERNRAETGGNVAAAYWWCGKRFQSQQIRRE